VGRHSTAGGSTAAAIIAADDAAATREGLCGSADHGDASGQPDVRAESRSPDLSQLATAHASLELGEEYVMPAQVPDRHSRFTSPLQVMHLKLLEEAVGIMVRYASRANPQQLARLVNVLAWIDDPEGAATLEAMTVPVSFASVCATLGLDPDRFGAHLRRQFRVWRDNPRRRKDWSFIRVGRLLTMREVAA